MKPKRPRLGEHSGGDDWPGFGDGATQAGQDAGHAAFVSVTSNVKSRRVGLVLPCALSLYRQVPG